MGTHDNASVHYRNASFSLSTARVPCAIILAFRTASYSAVNYSSNLTPLGFVASLIGENRRKVSKNVNW